MTVSGVVVTHGPHADLERCLASLAPQVDELLVVANKPLELELPANARLIENERPRGFSANVNLGVADTSGDPGALDLFWLPQVRNGRHAEGPFENMWRAMATDCKISSPLSPNCGVPLELPVAVRSKPIAQLARYIARVSPARG